MEQQRKTSKTIAGAIFFGVLLVLYFLRLPTTVQFGDTAELVMAAAKRYIAHPPGYPLWVWLQEFAIDTIPSHTEYWRAAFVNSLFAIGAYVLLWIHLKKGPLAIAVVAALAFSRVMWRYALLPDVFSMHVLFMSIVTTLYFIDNRKPWHVPLLIFVFCVSFSHHLTIVFLTPMVWHVMWVERRRSSTWIALVLGSLVSAGLYLSLQLRNPEHLYSWGEVNSFRAVVDHFLRRDYGTFQLVGTNEEGSFFVNFGALVTTLAENFWGLALTTAGFAIALRTKVKKNLDLRDGFGWLSLALYLVIFLGLSNTPLDGYRIEVMERFFLFVEVLLCFLLGRQLLKLLDGEKPKLHRAALAIVSLAAVTNFARFQSYNDYSENHIVDEYLRNFFAEAPTDRQVVLVTATDTRYFGARFAQAVLGVRPDVIVTSPKALIFEWAAKKFVRESKLSFDWWKVARANTIDLTNDLVLPNLDKAYFLSLYPLNEPTRYKITLLPIGRWIAPGTGSGLLEATVPYPLTEEKVSKIEGPYGRYDVYRDLTLDYLNYRLSFAKIVAEHGQVDRALQSILEYRKVLPYSRTLPRAECDLRDLLKQPNVAACREEQARVEKSVYPYEIERQ